MRTFRHKCVALSDFHGDRDSAVPNVLDNGLSTNGCSNLGRGEVSNHDLRPHRGRLLLDLCSNRSDGSLLNESYNFWGTKNGDIARTKRNRSGGFVYDELDNAGGVDVYHPARIRTPTGSLGTVARMNEFDLTSSGDVWTITMRGGENQINAYAISEWNRSLDRVEHNGSGQVLVVTGADKYWSTGIDLDEYSRQSHLEKQAFMARVDALLVRILTAPFVTIAAINGHVYAGGALLALAFDFRIMREDHGFFCLPSVDVEIPFTLGMAVLVSDKIPQPAAQDLVVSGRQIGGSEAQRLGIVNEAVSADRVLARSHEFGATLTGKDAKTLGTIKRRLYPFSVGHLSRSI